MILIWLILLAAIFISFRLFNLNMLLLCTQWFLPQKEVAGLFRHVEPWRMKNNICSWTLERHVEQNFWSYTERDLGAARFKVNYMRRPSSRHAVSAYSVPIIKYRLQFDARQKVLSLIVQCERLDVISVTVRLLSIRICSQQVRTPLRTHFRVHAFDFSA